MHQIDQDITLIVYDVDIQQTLVRHRQRELAEHPDAQPPYQLMPFSAAPMALGSVMRRFRRLVPSPNARKERYCNCMHQAARKVKSFTALSSIMTLTSVLSECISKKVAILRQNSATLRLKALAASYIIHIFVWKKRKETRDKCCKRVKYVLKTSTKVSDVKIIYYICSDFFCCSHYMWRPELINCECLWLKMKLF